LHLSGKEKAIQEQMKAMVKEQRGGTKRRLITLMHVGHAWREA